MPAINQADIARYPVSLQSAARAVFGQATIQRPAHPAQPEGRRSAGDRPQQRASA